MAKKKKTPVAQIEPISLPDEDLAKARAWLEGLNADIAYSQACLLYTSPSPRDS